jgi:hypothetical protein
VWQMREAWSCGSLTRARVSQICTVRRADDSMVDTMGYIQRRAAYCQPVMNGTAMVFRTPTACSSSKKQQACNTRMTFAIQ